MFWWKLCGVLTCARLAKIHGETSHRPSPKQESVGLDRPGKKKCWALRLRKQLVQTYNTVNALIYIYFFFRKIDLGFFNFHRHSRHSNIKVEIKTKSREEKKATKQTQKLWLNKEIRRNKYIYMYNIINKAHVYDLPKRPSQTTTSAGKSFHGTVRRTRDPRRHIIDARSGAKLRRVRIHAMITLNGVLRCSPDKSASRR